MDPSSRTAADDSYQLWVSDFFSKAARPSKAEHISGGANDSSASDESQLLFLIDSQSANPNTTIRAFDINGNLVPSYSVVIPQASLPVLGMGFTVIGSNLYMIGGFCTDDRLYDSDDDRVLPTGEIPPSDTHTYILDIRQIPGALESGLDLFQFIKRGPRMRRKKTLPIVYVVNQTLYVLSRWIRSDRDRSSMDFESLAIGDGDSGDSSSSALPNPPLLYHGDFRVGSHALVDDKSIVISMNPLIRSIYVFSLASSSWTCVDTNVDSLCFIGQPCYGRWKSGLCYALPPSGSALVVLDDVMSAPERELVIRGASSLVSCCTSHYFAAIDDVVFVFRTGSPSEDHRDSHRPVYLSIDKYKVSGDSIVEMGETISYLYAEPTSRPGCTGSLYLIPVSL